MFPLIWALGKRLVIEDDPEAAALPRRDEKRGVAYVGSRKQQTSGKTREYGFGPSC
jgi:hypothetical protein